MSTISRFSGQYRFLSNFWIADVHFEGLVFKTAEHAYQAAKLLTLIEREPFLECPTPGAAKRLGNSVKLRKDWLKVRVPMMTKIVRDKFTRHPYLRQLLLNTGDMKLVEGNDWGDSFWGICNGQGQNQLGLILMQIRDEVR